MKNQRTILYFLFLLALYSSSIAQTRPNIVLILADDQGWGDLSINGNANVRTPHIDRIAREGARFSRFYVAPLCAPTRAGLLTGRYHYRSGVWGVSSSKEFMNLNEVTLADLFKKAGYATGAFGKWHNGSQYPYHPNGRGFDEFYGFLSGHYANYFNTMLDHNGQAVRSKGYITDDLTDKALAFIEKNKAQPFLCYIPFNAPHSPFQVPDTYYNRVKTRGISQLADRGTDEDLTVTISALAMCENMDDHVGRILAKLEELKISDNTIVIYLSDNGPNSWRWNGGMKGRKGMADEGGVRVPFLIRWPGKIAAGRVIAGNAAYIDLLPTLADLAGISTKGTLPLDGISLKPALTGRSPEVPERILFTSINNNRSVRKGTYLYGGGQLFDLSGDSTQQHNIAPTQPATAKFLSDTLENWYTDMLRNVDTLRWLPVGYRQFPKTVLPAQDANLHPSKAGTISYAAPAPNSSWIANWNNTDSYASWLVEINSAGTYQVNIRYTSPAPGDAFTISFLESRLSGRIPEAFDPPLIPSPDRVKRVAESYEKEFKTLHAGEIKLQKGKGELKLLATHIAGSRFADIREIELILVK